MRVTQAPKLEARLDNIVRLLCLEPLEAFVLCTQLITEFYRVLLLSSLGYVHGLCNTGYTDPNAGPHA